MILDLWDHQRRGVDETVALLDAGENRICVTGPTGSGKSRIITELIQWAKGRAKKVVVYCNRILLTEQLIRFMKEANIQFGVRAAEFSEYFNSTEPIQISSLQTEWSRVYMTPDFWQLHKADLVIIDEIHANKGETTRTIVQDHLHMGASFVGFTATPLEVSNICDRLVVAGTVSECRDCGALLRAVVKAPDELDCSKIKTVATGEYNIEDIRKKVWTPQIFGRVAEHWMMFNPERKPTILFGPGVKESLWFAQQFEKIGVRAAHIDGKDAYLDGKLWQPTRLERQELLDELATGDISILCNRFVAREGIDVPQLYNIILATPFGSLLSYLQACGRVLRNHSSLSDHVIITDHGGNFWRHGSMNIDRDWEATWNERTKTITDLRLDKMRERKVPEPIVCPNPKCKTVRNGGTQCPACGFEHQKKSRMVLQFNGELKEVTGDILRPRRRASATSSIQYQWKGEYYRAVKAGMTFAQAEAYYAMNHRWQYPPRGLDYMPMDDIDWFRKVADVPWERIRHPSNGNGKEERYAGAEP